jgi:hypothetical protein
VTTEKKDLDHDYLDRLVRAVYRKLDYGNGMEMLEEQKDTVQFQ